MNQATNLGRSEQSEDELPLFATAKVTIIDVAKALTQKIITDPTLIHELSPEQFEEFICERLDAMGFEPKRTGRTNRKDGGIDLLFWPRTKMPFPFLGAAQVKHHRDPTKREGPSSVREFAGTIAMQPINMGVIVTNTSFTPDAEWFCRQQAKLLRLRDFKDISRWLLNNFSDDEEWREFPQVLELCPGVKIQLK